MLLVLWLLQRKHSARFAAELAGRSVDLIKANESEADLRKQLQTLELRFENILNLDAEAERLTAQNKKQASEIEALRVSYAEKKVVYDRLLKEVAIFDEKLAFAEMGVYEPHFDYTDSEEYKRAIEDVRAAQKDMVS